MVDVLRKTAEWWTSSSPSQARRVSPADRNVFEITEERIIRLNRVALEYPGPVRWYLEDAVVRAALLRYLKLQGASGRTQRELARLGGTLAGHHALRELIASTQRQVGDSWVPDDHQQRGNAAGEALCGFEGGSGYDFRHDCYSEADPLHVVYKRLIML